VNDLHRAPEPSNPRSVLAQTRSRSSRRGARPARPRWRRRTPGTAGGAVGTALNSGGLGADPEGVAGESRKGTRRGGRQAKVPVERPASSMGARGGC
jgi:hypothetical protein